MSVVQRKAMLKAEGFFPHKKNGKGTTIIYSRKHPTAKFVRVVVDSGIDSKTNKVVGKVGVKLCFVNRQKSWREITIQVFTTNAGLVKTIKAQEAAEKFVKTCKHCKAKKFTAKSGNVVCANACWTTWGNKKNATTKKATQKETQKKSKKTTQKKPQVIVAKGAAKKQRTYPLNKRVEKKAQKKFAAKILPGDLVTVEEIQGEKVTENFTGKILGIVTKVMDDTVDVDWTANNSQVEQYMLPRWNSYYIASGTVVDYRFKVLSREVKYAIVT
jgi:uncharacterized Zn finger protein (UPF0148 family)